MVVNEPEMMELFPELTFIGKLGEGGEAIVYLVRTREDEDLALKVLLHNDAASIAQFEKEARLLSEFDHTNIVKVYQTGVRGRYYFTAMEYCSGGSLHYRIAEKRFDDVQAGNLVIKIAKGLQYAHDHNVLHRDIKPENIMMTVEDEPKLVDFGLAFCAGEDASALEAVGSEGYAAPELWDNPEKVSLQSDLYALGSLLYTVLTRTLPDPHDVNFNHLFDRNRAYVHFIVKAMAKDASHRHSSATQFAKELQVIVNSSGRPKLIW